MKTTFYLLLWVLALDIGRGYAQDNSPYQYITYRINNRDTLAWTFPSPPKGFCKLYKVQNGEKILIHELQGPLVDVLFSGDTCSVIRKGGMPRGINLNINIYLVKEGEWQLLFDASIANINQGPMWRGFVFPSLIDTKTIYVRTENPPLESSPLYPYYKDRIIRINVEKNSVETFDLVDKQNLDELPYWQSGMKGLVLLYYLTQQKSLKK